MEKAVVTGGLGFIGSHIAKELAEKADQVLIVDEAKSRKNIAAFQHDVEVLNASICDYDKMKAAFKNAKTVFHQAALVSVPLSVKEPELTRKINVQGTLNVLKAAKENGVESVVLASSSAVYGNNDPPLKESMKPNPLSPYAQSKLQNESDAKEFYEKYGLKTVSLRYFNVFGPNQDPNSAYAAAIPKFITILKSNKQPIIYGDGNQTRDFIYVKDVAKANILASKAKTAASGNVFNIGSGKKISILGLLEKISLIMKKVAKPNFQPQRVGDIVHSYADVLSAEKVLDFKAKWDFDNALEETIDSYRYVHEEQP